MIYPGAHVRMILSWIGGFVSFSLSFLGISLSSGRICLLYSGCLLKSMDLYLSDDPEEQFSQSVSPRPAATAWPQDLYHLQIPMTLLRPTESKTLEAELSNYSTDNSDAGSSLRTIGLKEIYY